MPSTRHLVSVNGSLEFTTASVDPLSCVCVCVCLLCVCVCVCVFVVCEYMYMKEQKVYTWKKSNTGAVFEPTITRFLVVHH